MKLFHKLLFICSILLICIIPLIYYGDKCNEQRYVISTLADIVGTTPRHFTSEPTWQFNKGRKLKYSLKEFLQHYPSELSNTTLSDKEDGHPYQLSFFNDWAFSSLYEIWDAPLKARLLALVHGSGPYSRIPMVHQNPLFYEYDVECREQSNRARTWMEKDGSYLREGSYILHGDVHFFVELRKDGWSKTITGDAIYRLKKGSLYIPDTPPHDEDWEMIYAPQEAKPSVVDLPFGTYMFVSKVCYPSSLDDVIFIHILAVTPDIRKGEEQ